MDDGYLLFNSHGYFFLFQLGAVECLFWPMTSIAWRTRPARSQRESTGNGQVSIS